MHVESKLSPVFLQTIKFIFRCGGISDFTSVTRYITPEHISYIYTYIFFKKIKGIPKKHNVTPSQSHA